MMHAQPKGVSPGNALRLGPTQGLSWVQAASGLNKTLPISFSLNEVVSPAPAPSMCRGGGGGGGGVQEIHQGLVV